MSSIEFCPYKIVDPGWKSGLDYPHLGIEYISGGKQQPSSCPPGTYPDKATGHCIGTPEDNSTTTTQSGDSPREGGWTDKATGRWVGEGGPEDNTPIYLVRPPDEKVEPMVQNTPATLVEPNAFAWAGLAFLTSAVLTLIGSISRHK